MGSRLGILISSSVPLQEKEIVERSARACWPFLRAPQRLDEFRDRVLLAAPELSDRLLFRQTLYELALEQSEDVRGEMLAWSREHPETSFVFLERESVEGSRVYSGYACRAGFVLHEETRARRGHTALLDHVALSRPGTFEPFSRGFFYARALGPPE